MEVGVTCGGVWWPTECFQAVEELGFDVLWTGEHIVFHRPILDAIPLLAGVAAVTDRIRLGPAAIMAPLRHPTMLAKELATLDIVSAGRLTVVVGVGGDFPKEFEACDIPMARRGRRTSEIIEILRDYWTKERFSYHGEIFQLDDVWMHPKPVQAGGPPLWIAGRSDAAIKRAALLGDGYMPYMYTAERCRQAFEEVEASAARLGRGLRSPFTRSAFVYVSLDDSVERARELGIRDLSWRYGKDFTPWIDKYCVYGDPETVVSELRGFVEAGVDHLALGMIHEQSTAPDTAPSSADAKAILRTIERFGGELLPGLADRAPAADRAGSAHGGSLPPADAAGPASGDRAPAADPARPASGDRAPAADPAGPAHGGR